MFSALSLIRNPIRRRLDNASGFFPGHLPGIDLWSDRFSLRWLDRYFSNGGVLTLGSRKLEATPGRAG
jgi:hypothetical protein